MGFLFIFIFAGVVVIVGMIIWPKVLRSIGIASGRSGRLHQENDRRSTHTRRMRAFWIVYVLLLVLFVAYGVYFYQAHIDEHSGFGQRGPNSRVGVMSAIAED